MSLQTFLETGIAAGRLAWCSVLTAELPDVVTVVTDAGQVVPCEVLVTSESPLAVAPGDAVLVWFTPADGNSGVLIGRRGRSRAAPAAAAAPEELVIEATKNLVLKCGDGSITIREDGKILIKGKDLVSHAQRVNRIKGGSVAIN